MTMQTHLASNLNRSKLLITRPPVLGGIGLFDQWIYIFNTWVISTVFSFPTYQDDENEELDPEYIVTKSDQEDSKCEYVSIVFKQQFYDKHKKKIDKIVKKNITALKESIKVKSNSSGIMIKYFSNAKLRHFIDKAIENVSETSDSKWNPQNWYITARIDAPLTETQTERKIILRCLKEDGVVMDQVKSLIK